jgi:hypothetical protein
MAPAAANAARHLLARATLPALMKTATAADNFFGFAEPEFL